MTAEALRIRARVDAVEQYIQDNLRSKASLAPFFPQSVFNSESVRWALANIYSRAFVLGACETSLIHLPRQYVCDLEFVSCSGGATLMLPLVDMLNHAQFGSTEHNVVVEYDAGGGLLVRTTRAVSHGEELCVCYSQTDSDAELEAKYGIPLPLAA